MGVPSLNDLAVDGTLNTTNQPTNKRGQHSEKVLENAMHYLQPYSYMFEIFNLRTSDSNQIYRRFLAMAVMRNSTTQVYEIEDYQRYFTANKATNLTS